MPDFIEDGGSSDGEFIIAGRTGEWEPEDEPSEKVEAKSKNADKEEGYNRMGKMLEDSAEEDSGDDSDDDDENQEESKSEKPKSNKDKEQETEYKRLKNAVPALQRKVQEYQDKIREFNPAEVEKRTFERVKDEMAQWFAKNPDEVIEHALRAKGVDSTSYFRDKFLQLAEFEQKPDSEKQAIMAERARRQELEQAQQKLTKYEQDQAKRDEQLQKEEGAKFQSKIFQFVAQFCEENGLPSDNPLKVGRVVEQLIFGLERAQAGDPKYAGFNETKVAKLYQDATWKENVYDMKHMTWDRVKDRPEAREYLASCVKFIKDAAAKNGGGTVKRSGRQVSSSSRQGDGWGEFISESQLRAIKRKEEYL